MRRSSGSTAPPGKTNLPGMNLWPSWRLPISTRVLPRARSTRISVAASRGFRRAHFCWARNACHCDLGAVEHVAVDVAVDAGDVAVGLILPELPRARAVAHRGVVLGRAHPHRVIGEGAVGEDRLVEVDRGVDDRLLAEMALHLLQHHLHVGDGLLLLEMAMAGLRFGIRLRRRAPAAARRPRPARSARTSVTSSIGATAPIDEVIGAVGDADLLGAPANWPGSARRDGRRPRSP